MLKPFTSSLISDFLKWKAVDKSNWSLSRLVHCVLGFPPTRTLNLLDPGGLSMNWPIMGPTSPTAAGSLGLRAGGGVLVIGTVPAAGGGLVTGTVEGEEVPSSMVFPRIGDFLLGQKNRNGSLES